MVHKCYFIKLQNKIMINIPRRNKPAPLSSDGLVMTSSINRKWATMMHWWASENTGTLQNITDTGQGAVPKHIIDSFISVSTFKKKHTMQI